jgi:hypothetical protein
MQQWAAAGGLLLLGGEEPRLEDWERVVATVVDGQLLWLLHVLPLGLPLPALLPFRGKRVC